MKNLKVNIDGVMVLAVLAAAGAVYLHSKAAAIKTAVDPTSHDNLANRAVNGIGEAITGDEHWTLGGAIYDLTHDEVSL